MVLRESFVPHQLPADARTFGATTFPGVPFMFEYFLANPPADGWPAGCGVSFLPGRDCRPRRSRGFHRALRRQDPFVLWHQRIGRHLLSTPATRSARTTPSGGRCPESPSRSCRMTDTPRGNGAGPRAERRRVDWLCRRDGERILRRRVPDRRLRSVRRDRAICCSPGRVSSFINVAGKKVQPGEVEDVLQPDAGSARRPGARSRRPSARASRS